MTVRQIAFVVLAMAALVNSTVARAEVSIEGHYLQNRRCKGDRTDPPALRVTIASNEITYAGGVCSIDSRRSEGDKVIFGVTCRFRSGAVMGADIAFTPLGDGSLHMVQQDGTFEADLHKCADRR